MQSSGGAPDPSQDRHIRVFISSTFRDMQEERELLIKQVFPELRRMCSERFVTFTEVDLRWGITEEQASEGKVLPICLEEIYACRPHFIGLLGERYGWISDSIPLGVIDREPWLKEHVGNRTSVTELEILHGVLNNPKMADHAFFYFRDPAYLKKIPKERLDDFRTEDPASEDKLKDLKERIRKSGKPVLENYPNPKALAAAVLAQFVPLINDLYPKEDVPDALDQEVMGHEAYARQKLLAYVERPAHIQAIDSFAKGEHSGQGLVLTGESGGGKTALLASWAKQWRKNHTNDFVFAHYFGSTPESSSVPGFLRRLLGEIKRHYEITEDIPAQPEKLSESLPLWLAQTVGKGRIVLVLDALNQIEGSEPDRRVSFLPRFFPSHVTVIASALPSPALGTLRDRGWVEHELPPTDTVERRRMIDFFFQHYRKEPGHKLREEIVTAPGSANPLFLRTVLEELRQFGSFEELPVRVAWYLKAQSSEKLFRLVLSRWQADFDGGRDLVRRALCLLWAARQGLSENEWLEMLQTKEPLPRQTWRPLFLAMQPHLSQRSGLYAFGHDFLPQAVEAEFLTAEENRRIAHRSLADYFENQLGMTPRKASEWPWQLQAAKDWSRLEARLTDRELFLALYNDRTQWELSGYWLSLPEPAANMGQSYALAFERWLKIDASLAEDYFLPHQLGTFLIRTGFYLEATPLLGRALECCERVLAPEHPDTFTTIKSLADSLAMKGDYAQAEILYRRVLESRERVLGPEHSDTLASINNLAVLLWNTGDYAQAEILYRRVLESSERVLGPEHPSTLTSVDNLAVLLSNAGYYTKAESFYRRALENRERVLGPEHPETLVSVNNLAGLFESKGDYTEAEPLYRRALESFERVLGPEHPQTLVSVNNLAFLFFRTGDYAQAEPLYRRALENRERVLGPEHPATLTSINNLALMLKSKGDYAQAEPLYLRALAIRQRVLGPEHPHTLASVNNLAGLRFHTGDYARAEPLFHRVLAGLIALSRAMGREHPNLQACLGSFVSCLGKIGYTEAEIHGKMREILG